MADLHTTLVHIDIIYDQPVQVAPLVRRVTANNPSSFTGLGTNTYIVGRNRFSVIDPGPNDPEHIAAILAATDGKIDRIIATHNHEDHSQAALPLAQATGAAVVGMPPSEEMEYIDHTFQPDVIVADGEVINCGEYTLSAVYTPGHLKAHCCFVLNDGEMVFAGDHVMQGASVVIIPSHGGTMWEYLESVQKLQGRGYDLLAPAHGHILSDVDQVLQELYDHRIRRETKVLNALTALKRGTIEQLAPYVYPEVSGDLIKGTHFAMSAHLLKLVHDGVVRHHHEKHWLLGEEIWELIDP